MTVETTINLLQAINGQVSPLVSCPELRDYPMSLDTLVLPIALTSMEDGFFNGRNEDNTSEDNYVIRVLFEALGQGDLGSRSTDGVRILDEFRRKYLDENTYEVIGRKILQTEPYSIFILEQAQTFRNTGLTIIEYPDDSGFWFHGFEIRLTIRMEWEHNC